MYNELDNWHKIYNPCQFEKNICLKNRKDNTINGCCPTCKLNTAVGCSIRSLGCKLFLCQEAYNNLSNEAKEKYLNLKFMISDLKLYIELNYQID